MHLNHVVIGNSLASVLYAYYNDCSLIVTRPRAPLFFETIDVRDTLSEFDNTQRSDKIWSHLLLSLSMQGMVIAGFEDKSVFVGEDKVKLKLKGTPPLEISFDKCHIFDTEYVKLTVDVAKTTEQQYTVYDWVNVRSGSSHLIDVIKTEDSFINSVYFYKSERVDGNLNRRDAVAVSTLSEEQIRCFDYSDTMAKFKIEYLMKKRGITGTTSGKSKAPILVEPSSREAVRIENHHYENTSKLTFELSCTPQETIDRYARSAK